MSDTDLTVLILREIREDVRSNKTRLESMDRRLESMDRRLGSMDGDLKSMNTRLASMDTRLEVVEHTLLDAAGQIQLLVRYFANLSGRVTKLEGHKA
ncbi:MAG: hypothetical protein JWO36_1435 [Myxococcales bacterium]|nr:hypothetical protein [Myxococcales bacterium]